MSADAFVTRNMDATERSVVLETMAQHDLTAKQRLAVIKALDERAKIAPFNRYYAYHNTHAVCAAVVRGESPADLAWLRGKPAEVH